MENWRKKVCGMLEYRVVYKVRGEGYTITEPWIDCQTTDENEARQQRDSLLDWYKQQDVPAEVWVESRTISSWSKATLT